MAVRVAVLHGHAGGARMWEHLDQRWALYGPVPLAVTQHRFAPP